MAQSGSSNKKVANSLVAVSASAVLAVYAAGYTRTRSAAEKLDAQSEERRAGAPEGRGSVRSAPANAEHPPAESAPAVYDWAHDQGNTPTQTASVAYANSPASIASGPASPAALPEAPAATRLAEAPAAAPERKPEAASSLTLHAPSPAQAAEPAPTVAVVSAPAPVVTAPTVAAAAPPIPPTAPSAPQPKWKDGTYTGWGTSRHGDIQAAVVIEGGRILSANIAQCLTRYSCNVIAMLPPEVIQRQSGEVDYVSGATQSTNAYYYAVAEALGKAK
jgi:uncharacterized protein with FMN-binding domain